MLKNFIPNFRYKISVGKRRKSIPAFWFNAVRNAGDLVTPFILKREGFSPKLIDPKDAILLSCGSIMQRVPSDFENYIFGSGFLNEGPSVELSKAKVIAVRGKFTRDRINAPKNTVLGDPGLLMSEFLQTRSKKKYLVGLIPHYSEKKDPLLPKLLDTYQKSVLFIDIQTDPLVVLKKIDQCEYIFSSSLHGNIFSDSLLIPNCWVSFSKFNSSKFFKFNDYYSSLDMEGVEPISLLKCHSLEEVVERVSNPPEEKINKIKMKLRTSFDQIVQILQN